ncbi:MAG: type transport system permease protein [Solirubrobacteraceae bacterium]|jgi:ABC-2 type transport system permease protein|nr:type transport system permease protein [Solirubrobacteraceae bacterium]
MSGAQLVVRQLRLEQRVYWRNPEAAFFGFALPLGLLAIFGATSQMDGPYQRADLAPHALLVPGILAFGLIVAAYGFLAATFTNLRAEGVLKRIRATPVSPRLYIGVHLLSTVCTSILIAALTIALGAAAFETAPVRPLTTIVVVMLGVTCFASLGIAISAFIPTPNSAGVITNATYLPLALVSGTFNTGLQLPTWLDRAVGVFPVKALTHGLRMGYDPAAHTWPTADLLVLLAWTALGVILSLRFFRWEPPTR